MMVITLKISIPILITNKKMFGHTNDGNVREYTINLKKDFLIMIQDFTGSYFLMNLMP